MHSVIHGLSVCPPNTSFCQVHDAARPLIRPETIDYLAREAKKVHVIAVARPARDTIRMIQTSISSNEPQLTETLDRSRLWQMETPQVSRFDWLSTALMDANENEIEVTDEIEALEKNDKKVCLFDPGYPNPKITTPEDLILVERLLNQ